LKNKIRFTKETIMLSLILILSAILNFGNLSIEGYANGYYAAGVKSMTMSLKNFFFVSFDPAGFVSIDKPPLGFWIQTISAKIFGFSGWSLLFPEALAGVISVWLLYYIVKRSFGSAAGLISALCLAVTPVFIATSRNNTVDNLLVLTLLFACWAISIAAEKGKLKYLIISLVLVGIGFNIKMLQAYMIGPALYITYLLSNAVSLKKRIIHLVLGTFILFAVSLSWGLIVDSVPASNRPFVGSSTNNSVMELIFGHNGLERLGLSGTSTGGAGSFGGGNRQNGQLGKGTGTGNNMPQGTPPSGDSNASMPQGTPPANNQGNNNADSNMNTPPAGNDQNNKGMGPGSSMQPPSGKNFDRHSGGGMGGMSSGLAGTFGAQTPAGITRLFSKNVLSDQIVWFIPLAVFGFIAAAIKEKLRFRLDNKRKQSLILWFMWLLPEFIYFSYTTGLFHPYYLSMMAPPIAALSGIGLAAMWSLYKKGGWKSWILPVALAAEGAVQSLMLSYFSSISGILRTIMLASLILSLACSAVLAVVNFTKNKNERLKMILVSIAFIGILVIPSVGSFAALNHTISGTIPAAGLELLSNNQAEGRGMNSSSSNSKLIKFLKDNITTEKYSLVVSSSQSAQDLIINGGQSVMALGGFSGSDNILSLSQFKEMVNKGEIRYVLTGGMGQNSEIMNWVQKNGKAVEESKWKDTDTKGMNGGDGGNSEQLYDLKAK
jgi:4-amino-4-deoxy-L-arabinose transferase-like glycosyltransferase